MRLSLSFSILLIFSSMVSNAQNKVKITTIEETNPIPIEYKWMGTSSRTLTLMKIAYTKPDGFEEDGKYVSFGEYPKLGQMFSCLGNCLKSDDGQFLAFISVNDIFTQDFADNMKSFFPGKSFDFVDKQHLNQIKYVIMSYYGEEIADNWKSLLDYYPEEEANIKFNADTVIRFSLALQPQDYYKKKYKYIDALFLQKKDRGYINFYCFYTDKGKKKLDFYWKKIEGVLHYEDYEDCESRR